MARPLLRLEELDRLGPFYHSFESFGIAVPHDSEGTKRLNQRTKEGPICGYLQLAIEKARTESKDSPSVLELFCADGYYAAHARRMGAGIVHGVDTNKRLVRKANAMFDVLYGEAEAFRVADVLDLVPEEPYDVVLCCGGLYHLEDPAALLHRCRAWTIRYLVVQAVVSLDHEGDADYFETPAPGLSHGSRFSAQRLGRMLDEAGWEVLDWHRNLNPGCVEQRDAGSAFALCRPRR